MNQLEDVVVHDLNDIDKIITLRQLIYLCHSDVLVLICLPISLIALLLRYSNFILIMNLVGMICRAK